MAGAANSAVVLGTASSRMNKCSAKTFWMMTIETFHPCHPSMTSLCYLDKEMIFKDRYSDFNTSSTQTKWYTGLPAGTNNDKWYVCKLKWLWCNCNMSTKDVGCRLIWWGCNLCCTDVIASPILRMGHRHATVVPIKDITLIDQAGTLTQLSGWEWDLILNKHFRKIIHGRICLMYESHH